MKAGDLVRHVKSGRLAIVSRFDLADFGMVNIVCISNLKALQPARWHDTRGTPTQWPYWACEVLSESR